MDHNFINLEENKNKILCSSGSNYFVVKSDGSVNRCFSDLTYLGDMLEYPSFVKKKATECVVGYKCDASCDQMFCTQWNNPRKRDFYENNPVCIKWKDNDPNNLNLNGSFFVIYLTDKCNFNCPYCCNYYPDGIKERPINYNERTTSDWIKFFDILKNNLNIVQLNFNGGEPLLRDDIDIILFNALKNNFDCSLVTNFSVFKSLEKILNKDINNKENLQFSITLHPINTIYNFNKILKYILLFKECGYKIRISLLGWKENLKYHERYKIIFNEIGIDYWLKWCGGYSYDQNTIDYLIKEGAGKSTAKYLYENNLLDNNTSNYKCTAGIDYFIIDNEGMAYKCYGVYHNKKNILFNLNNYKNFNFNNLNSNCNKMNCFKDCEGYKVEVWNNKNIKIWNNIYWRPRLDSIKDISLDNIFFQIDMVLGCFNNCPYCFIENKNCRNKKDIKFIDTEKLLNLIKHISNIKKGYKFINISGSGEQLIHNDFVKICNTFTEYGFNIELITSGLLYSKKLFLLKNKEKINIIISFHPSSKNWNYNKMNTLLYNLKNEKFRSLNSTFVKYEGNMSFYNEIKNLTKKYKMFMHEIEHRKKIEFIKQQNNNL
jgi:molybdenum cofactor biosynthesis enzyme MoaA